MLNFEIPTMLFSLSAFIVLMLLVSRFALRPMLGTMKQREDYIENQIKTAEQNRIDAEDLVKQQLDALTRARKESRDMIEKAKQQKLLEADIILKEAQARAERIVQDGITEIQREKEKALASLRDEVGSMAILLASKVLAQEISAKSQSSLMREYFEEIGSKVQ